MEAVRKLARVLHTGKFAVQMRTDELEQCLAAADNDAAHVPAREDMPGGAEALGRIESRSQGDLLPQVP